MRNYESIGYFLDKFKEGAYTYDNGVVTNTKTGRVVKGTKYGKGKYLSFDSETADNKRMRARIHVVIFAYFHGMDELRKHETIDHVDGDKYNNRIENLQGMSSIANVEKHLETSSRLGRRLTESEVRDIRTSGYGPTKLSEIHSVSRKTIYEIRKGRTYKQFL